MARKKVSQALDLLQATCYCSLMAIIKNNFLIVTSQPARPRPTRRYFAFNKWSRLMQSTFYSCFLIKAIAVEKKNQPCDIRHRQLSPGDSSPLRGIFFYSKDSNLLPPAAQGNRITPNTVFSVPPGGRVFFGSIVETFGLGRQARVRRAPGIFGSVGPEILILLVYFSSKAQNTLYSFQVPTPFFLTLPNRCFVLSGFFLYSAIKETHPFFALYLYNIK